MQSSRTGQATRFRSALLLVALAQASVACAHSAAVPPPVQPQPTVLDLEPTTITVSDTSEVREGSIRLELTATTIVVSDDGWDEPNRVAAASRP